MATDTYQPLESDKHVRLLKLLPGEVHEPICTELVHTSLDDAADVYEAASYTWGVDEPSNMIRCNGRPFGLRRNAYDLMQRLRRLSEPCTIWMDCICINQGDVKEREAQVKIMHLVYRQAKSVCIWLGLEGDDSAQAMRFATTLDSPSLVENALRYIRASDDYWYLQKPFLFESLPQNDSNIRLVNALTALMQRSWLSRVWVQQEAAFCNNTRVLCGGDGISWNQFFALAWILSVRTSSGYPEWLEDHVKRLEIPVRAAFSIQHSRATHLNLETTFEQQSHYKAGDKQTAYSEATTDEQLVLDDIERWNEHWLKRRRTATDRSLNSLMRTCSGCEATDARDKVYALLNMATENENASPIDVDYISPWPVVYSRAAKWMYSANHGRRTNGTMLMAGRCNQQGTEMPSWAPDCRQRLEFAFVVHGFWAAGGDRSRAEVKFVKVSKSLLKAEFDPPYSRVLKNGKLKRVASEGLEISAFLVDRIVYRSPATYIPADGLKDDAPNVPFKLDSDLAYISQSLSIYFTGETGSEAYAGTIIAGTNHNDEIADARYERVGFDGLRSWLHEGSSRPQPNWDYYNAMCSVAIRTDKCFCITAHGTMCLAPSLTEVGDFMAILKGVTHPMALRKVGRSDGDQLYELLGESYMHRVMRGRALNLIDEFKSKYVPGSEMETSSENKGGYGDDAADTSPCEHFPFNPRSDYSKIRRVLGKRKITLV